MAFAEKRAGERVEFTDEVGELNTAKFRVDRRAKDYRVHGDARFALKDVYRNLRHLSHWAIE